MEQQLLYLECLNYNENLVHEFKATNLPWYVIEIQNPELNRRQYLCGLISMSQKPVYLFKRKQGNKSRLIKFRPLYSNAAQIIKNKTNILTCRLGKVIIEATLYDSKKVLYILYYNHQFIKNDEILIKRITHGVTIYNPRDSR